jgi:peptidoglycan/xylan/chitin deacetylase (PgdA/CDA1 family)
VTSSTAILLQAGGGGRPLLQTADSILRSRATPARTMICLSAAHRSPPLVDSIAIRLDASIVEPHDAGEGSLNAALRAAETSYILVLRSGYMLDDSFLEECEAAFARDASAAALAPAIRLQTADATSHLEWIPCATNGAAVLNDTRSVPRVFAVRRDVCQALGAFDDRFGDLAEYEFWLRLVLAGHKVAILDEPLVAHDLSVAAHKGPPYAAHDGPSDAANAGGFTPRHPASDSQHLDQFRAILKKHAAAIGDEMHELLVAREVRFGALQEAHRELIVRRDAGLAELDRLRAEAAHLRAYIAHHDREDIDWGELRRTDPVSRDWGYDRGIPIDRRYIDEFLAAHSSDVRGAVLEVQEDEFTRAYGGPRVSASTVVDVDASNGRASVLADLRCAPGIPADHFDCIILTQTLHVIDDMPAVLRECHRILKPGGVLLATVPAASRVCLEYGRDGDFWRTTPAGARALMRTSFAPSAVSTSVFGNVLTNVAFLHGLATTELADADFGQHDPYVPAITGIRARKGTSPSARAARGVVLLYHRIEEAAGAFDLSVPPALFDAHLAWLRRECSVVSVETLLDTPPESLPERAVALTFDDGYLDSLETVAPFLGAHEFPATFFLTTRWLKQHGEYWWDVLERVPLADAERTRLHGLMVHATIEQRDALVGELAARHGAGGARVRPITAEEVRQLARQPRVTIGAHSVDHLALPDQTVEVVRREIEESCAALARVVGKPIGLFAYPYGAYDCASAAVVRSSCRWGFSCDERPLTESFDAAAVPRLDVKRWEVPEFAARIESRLRLRRRGQVSVFNPLV